MVGDETLRQECPPRAYGTVNYYMLIHTSTHAVYTKTQFFIVFLHRQVNSHTPTLIPVQTYTFFKLEK